MRLESTEQNPDLSERPDRIAAVLETAIDSYKKGEASQWLLGDSLNELRKLGLTWWEISKRFKQEGKIDCSDSWLHEVGTVAKDFPAETRTGESFWTFAKVSRAVSAVKAKIIKAKLPMPQLDPVECKNRLIDAAKLHNGTEKQMAAAIAAKYAPGLHQSKNAALEAAPPSRKINATDRELEAFLVEFVGRAENQWVLIVAKDEQQARRIGGFPLRGRVGRRKGTILKGIGTLKLPRGKYSITRMLASENVTDAERLGEKAKEMIHYEMLPILDEPAPPKPISVQAPRSSMSQKCHKPKRSTRTPSH